MTYALAETGGLVEIAETEEELVTCWREEVLTLAGWHTGFARAIANRGDIDVRLACSLLESGCDQRTAWRILR
ncbi:MAG: hypothetical protein ACR2OD_01780 [Gaiellaceae bacterium]